MMPVPCDTVSAIASVALRNPSPSAARSHESHAGCRPATIRQSVSPHTWTPTGIGAAAITLAMASAAASIGTGPFERPGANVTSAGSSITAITSTPGRARVDHVDVGLHAIHEAVHDTIPQPVVWTAGREQREEQRHRSGELRLDLGPFDHLEHRRGATERLRRRF